jgi:hypothetical protein
VQDDGESSMMQGIEEAYSQWLDQGKISGEDF